MKRHSSRREFLKTASLSTFGIILASKASPAFGYPANEKLDIGVVGVANRGNANLNGVSSQNIAALCDIDDNYLRSASKRFSGAKTFNDYRKLVDQKLDAVVVSTPDHMHAFATVAAMKAGKHAYCEKPLTHSVFEARYVQETAKKHNRVTQMGTQIHAGDNYRRVVELVQSGAIGPVRECHVWCGKNWGGGERPTATPPVPENIHYDQWLGPAPYRPYHSVYLPANWRRWWDFGGGTLGDMGCHYLDLAFWALKFGHPDTIAAQGSKVHKETCPRWLTIDWEFPKRHDMVPCKLSWYDSGKQPKILGELGIKKPWGNAVLFIGDKGQLLADYGRRILMPEKDFKDFAAPAKTIPDSIGHHKEWIEACKTGGATTCNFSYSGNLTESVLLGNVAYRTGEKLAWNGAKLEVTNCKAASQFIRREYREGWAL